MARKEADINAIVDHGSCGSCYYYDERPDERFIHHGITINNSTFELIGFKDSEIYNSSLEHCIFVRCYFKKTKLINVLFTGSLFIDCTFDGLNIVNCNFEYCKFENCFVEYDEILGSLPAKQNLRWKLCINFANECKRAGNIDQFIKFYYEEKKSSEKFYLEVALRNSDYYKRKYSILDSFIFAGKYTRSKLSKLVWGYGESLKKLISNMIITVVAFALILNAVESKLSIFASLKLSAANFVNYQTSYELSKVVENISMVENIVGIVFMGFFVTALFTSINRR